MKLLRARLFFTFPSTLISATIRFYANSNLTWSSKLFLRKMQNRKVHPLITFQISCSCASARKDFFNFAVCSLKQQRILRENHSREEPALCSRRTLIHTATWRQNKRRVRPWAITQQASQSKMFRAAKHLVSCQMTKKILRLSILMKNLKIQRARKKTWRLTWASLTRELTL